MFFVLTILQQGKLVSVPLCGWCPLASVKAIPTRSGMEPRQADPQIFYYIAPRQDQPRGWHLNCLPGHTNPREKETCLLKSISSSSTLTAATGHWTDSGSPNPLTANDLGVHLHK